jgi:hypothetical protein
VAPPPPSISRLAPTAGQANRVVPVKQQNPSVQLQNLGSKQQDPGTQLQNLGSKQQDPGTQLQNPGAQLQNQSVQQQNPSAQQLNPGAHHQVWPGYDIMNILVLLKNGDNVGNSDLKCSYL